MGMQSGTFVQSTNSAIITTLYNDPGAPISIGTWCAQAALLRCCVPGSGTNIRLQFRRNSVALFTSNLIGSSGTQYSTATTSGALANFGTIVDEILLIAESNAALCAGDSLQWKVCLTVSDNYTSGGALPSPSNCICTFNCTSSFFTNSGYVAIT